MKRRLINGRRHARATPPNSNYRGSLVLSLMVHFKARKLAACSRADERRKLNNRVLCHAPAATHPRRCQSDRCIPSPAGCCSRCRPIRRSTRTGTRPRTWRTSRDGCKRFCIQLKEIRLNQQRKTILEVFGKMLITSASQKLNLILDTYETISGKQIKFHAQLNYV